MIDAQFRPLSLEVGRLQTENTRQLKTIQELLAQNERLRGALEKWLEIVTEALRPL